MPTEFNDTLLIKYFLQKTTEEEKRCIYEWLNASTEHKKEFNRLKFIRNFPAIKYLSQSIDTEQELANLKARIYRRKAHWEKVRILSYTTITTAAVIALILVFTLFRNSSTPSDAPQSVAQDGKNVIAIPKGLEGSVTLADGTKVWINSGSRIIYPEDYSVINRKIYLDGEAYFEVKPDKAHPFTVETSNVNILVTGTRFNLSSYKDDHTIEATLCQGVITLRQHADPTGKNDIRLLPNDKIIYQKKNGEIRKESVDSHQASLWKDGILCFKEVPLREIVKKLERKFNTPITIEDPEIGNYVYTATFEKEKGLQAILDIIATSAPISFHTESNGSITIQQT